MKILDAKIVRSAAGPTTIFLETNLPSTMWPFTEPACLQLSIATEVDAVEYVRQNFNIDNPEVV